MTAHLQPIRERVRDLGLALALLYACHRLLSALSGGRIAILPYSIVAQPIRADELAWLRDASAISVRAVAPDDPVLLQSPRPRDVVRKRLADGLQCFVATRGTRFLGHIWLARGRYEEDEVNCEFRLAEPARSAWDLDVYVEPDFRFGRTMARLWRAVNEDLGRRGVQWSFSRISLFNAPSRRAHGRLGALEVGKAIFLKIGRWQWQWIPSSPFVRVERGAAQGHCVLALHPPEAGGRQPAQGPGAAATAGLAARRRAALVLGLDSHGLSAIRALADAGVPTYAMDKDLTLPGARSNRLRGLFTTESFEGEALVQALLSARASLRSYDDVVLLAMNDRQVETIGRHIEALRGRFRVSWADCAAKVLQLQRKDELETASRAQGLRYPRSALLRDPEPGEAQTFEFPVIIKPVRPLSSFKTHIASDVAQLRELLGRHTADLPILCQEYVAGDDRSIFFGALMLDRGRVVHRMAGRKIASFPPARGQTIIAETVDDAEVLAETERFFEGWGMSGPVSLELKRDPSGRCWVIEPTVGRSDFWLELCVAAGFNQPLMEFQLACGLPLQPPGAMQPVVWYDSERAPLAYAQQVLACRRLRPMSKAQTFPYFGHRDAAPFRHAMSRLARRGLRKVFGGPAP